MAEQELEIHCPHCGRTNELHDGHDPDARPGADDTAICWGCRGFMVYVAGPFGLAVRVPTAEEQAEIEADPRVKRALGAIAESYDVSTALELWRGR